MCARSLRRRPWWLASRRRHTRPHYGRPRARGVTGTRATPGCFCPPAGAGCTACPSGLSIKKETAPPVQAWFSPWEPKPTRACGRCPSTATHIDCGELGSLFGNQGHARSSAHTQEPRPHRDQVTSQCLYAHGQRRRECLYGPPTPVKT